MNYKLLLQKYMALIISIEDEDYLIHIKSSPLTSKEIRNAFSNEEIAALKEIRENINVNI